MPCAGSVLSEAHIAYNGSLVVKGDIDAFCGPHGRSHHAPRLPLEPVHMDLDFFVSLEEQRVSGIVTHSVVARSDNASELVLNAEDFSVLRVLDHKYSYDGHTVRIEIDPIKKGETAKIAVEFCVKNPVTGMVFSGRGDGTFAVSDHETERARYWLPLVDHPIVRTTLRFNISTKEDDGLTVLANGFLTDETVKDGVKTTSWQMDQRTPSYLLCVAIGKFLCVKDDDPSGRDIQYFVPNDSRYKHTKEDLRLSFGRTPAMIAFMERKVGVPLPWPKYYQFAAGELGGAMENSSLVSYDEAYVTCPRDAPSQCSGIDSTVVHELAHTWFGDCVVCADFLYSFMKESFATLISYEWAHDQSGVDEFQYRLLSAALAYQSEAGVYMRPVVSRYYESSWQLFDSHIYSGGAWRLHMLRCKLGDEVFWHGVSKYIKKNMWKTVEADDLRRSLEEVSGESLTRFFDQWFYGKGYPILEASFSYSNGLATVNVRQTQVNPQRGLEAFDISLDVAFEVSEGVWERKKVVMEDGASTARVVVATASYPLQTVLDPDMKVLFKLGQFSGLGDYQLIRTLKKGPTFACKNMAINLLHESGSKTARAALEEASQSEGFPAVRSQIYGKLLENNRPSSRRKLIECLSTEKDPRGRISLLHALRGFRHAEVESAIVKFLESAAENNESSGAVAAALNGLGSQRNAEHIDFIASFLEDSSKNYKGGRIPSAAAGALGRIGDMRAMEILKRNLEYDDGRYPSRVRNMIIYSMESLVKWESSANRKKLYDYMRDFFVNSEVTMERIAAARVLAGLGDINVDHSLFRELEKESMNQFKPDARKIKETALKNGSWRPDGTATKDIHVGVEKTSSELTALKTRIEELESKLEAKLSGKKEDADKKGESDTLAKGEENGKPEENKKNVDGDSSSNTS